MLTKEDELNFCTQRVMYLILELKGRKARSQELRNKSQELISSCQQTMLITKEIMHSSQDLISENYKIVRNG